MEAYLKKAIDKKEYKAPLKKVKDSKIVCVPFGKVDKKDYFSNFVALERGMVRVKLTRKAVDSVYMGERFSVGVRKALTFSDCDSDDSKVEKIKTLFHKSSISDMNKYYLALAEYQFITPSEVKGWLGRPLHGDYNASDVTPTSSSNKQSNQLKG